MCGDKDFKRHSSRKSWRDCQQKSAEKRLSSKVIIWLVTIISHDCKVKNLLKEFQMYLKNNGLISKTNKQQTKNERTNKKRERFYS